MGIGLKCESTNQTLKLLPMRQHEMRMCYALLEKNFLQIPPQRLKEKAHSKEMPMGYGIKSRS